MDARERYFWDLTGYLVVRNVLTAEELSECNAAIDHCMDQMQQSPDNGGTQGKSNALQGTGQQTLPNLLELPHPHCEPFRRLLVHPQVVCRLNAMCGKGFRHDHGPWVSYSPKGTEGLILHGAGEPHRPYVAYHHQNGQFYCAGVTVTYGSWPTARPAMAVLPACRAATKPNSPCPPACAPATSRWM